MSEIRAKLRSGGRLVIPSKYRRALSIKPGDEVVLVLEEGEIRIVTARQAIRRAQAIVRHYIPAGRNLSEELIQERREEDARA